MANPTAKRRWHLDDALSTYQLDRWGMGYFGVSENGTVQVLPRKEGHSPIDLQSLVEEVRRRGIAPPLLLRFPDLVEARIDELHNAFAAAIKEYGYGGGYRGVYPIKVNQDRWVVDPIVSGSADHLYGLEAGTKPELLAVMALARADDALVICNGYKDEEYVDAALLCQRLGRQVFLVLEKESELDLVVARARAMKVKPNLGVRVRLSSRGAGKWKQSAGDRAKFGLSADEVVRAVKRLKEEDLFDCLKMVHFHLGSQVSAIRSLKDALAEATRFYVELTAMGAPLKYLDVGGGLGIDYDGSGSSWAASVNYSLQEYANDVVYYTAQACDEAEVAHPTLVTESGRAVVAPHAVLITEVLGVTSFVPEGELEVPEDHDNVVVRTLSELYREVSRKNFLEVYHDALYNKEQVLTLFSLGHLSLEERVIAERLYWALCGKILTIARGEPEFPEELESLDAALADIYYCNFSLFQSLPDAWAVDQLFPVLPIHRLGESPDRRVVLADVTCDSDGKLTRFIGGRDVEDVLPVHALGDEPYYLGVFLVGAYQESLGDLHNLFGKINALNVRSSETGYRIEHVEAGDTVLEVLRVAGYSRNQLVSRLRMAAEDAIDEGRMSLDDSREILSFYEAGLNGYTYLERDTE
ncbi:MAG: biosynthetic arginine decarboxylase [Deltaproteobacteria bacterium]|nr:biosynthetic arginine decarboxylase [Deltaproteobacteria bacterium]